RRLTAEVRVEDVRARVDLASADEVDHRGEALPLVHRVGDHRLEARAGAHRLERALVRDPVRACVEPVTEQTITVSKNTPSSASCSATSTAHRANPRPPSG